jgi:hypothetical protein
MAKSRIYGRRSRHSGIAAAGFAGDFAMGRYRVETERALAERARRAPQRFDLDRAELEERRDWADGIDARPLEGSAASAGLILLAILVSAVALFPAMEAMAYHLL